MKKSKKLLLLLVGLTFTFTLGVLSYSQMAEIQSKMLIIYLLIGLVAVLSIAFAMRKVKEEKEGQPLEDELTTNIKHKAGYYAYLSTIYMWLIIFLFKDLLSDNTETLIGGGILLSGVIGFVCKEIVTRKLNEK